MKQLTIVAFEYGIDFSLNVTIFITILTFRFRINLNKNMQLFFTQER